MSILGRCAAGVNARVLSEYWSLPPAWANRCSVGLQPPETSSESQARLCIGSTRLPVLGVAMATCLRALKPFVSTGIEWGYRRIPRSFISCTNDVGGVRLESTNALTRMPASLNSRAVAYAESLLVATTTSRPGAIPCRRKNFSAAPASMIPGRSLLEKIKGCSREPVARTTRLARTSHSRSRGERGLLRATDSVRATRSWS